MSAERASEYTPTTDEVRAVWMEWSEYGALTDRPASTDRTGMVAEFDRWLARVIAEARARGARTALLRFVQVIEQACPHEDEHPEGSREVCDFVFALEDEATARAEQEDV